MLGGVYFCNGGRPVESVDAYTVFDAGSMRVFSVVDGQLVLTDSAPERLSEIKVIDAATYNQIKLKCLPANTCYLKSDGDTPSQVPVFVDGQVPDAIGGVSAEREATAGGVYSLSGTLLRNTSDVEGLPAGLYIVGGRKTVVR